MGATYDAINDRILLTGDGSGGCACRISTPTPPSGASQVFYVLRFWIDSGADLITTDNSPSVSGWDPGCHLGFNFDATAPVLGDLNNDIQEYKDFFGLCPYNQSGVADLDEYYLRSDTSYMWHGFQTGSPPNSNKFQYFSDGNGGSLNYVTYCGNSINTSRTCAYPKTETAGLAYTAVWRVFGSAIDETVTAETWVNEGSQSLSTFDLETDLDGDDPRSSIPATYTHDSVVINGAAETGTNWRPSSGVMGFPTDFMARYPFATEQMVIDYVGVRYDTDA